MARKNTASGNDLAQLCDETARELLDADRTRGGLIAHLDLYALCFEPRARGVEVTLTFGGPSIWLEVSSSRVTLRGQWWGQDYRRRLTIREDTLAELMGRS